MDHEQGKGSDLPLFMVCLSRLLKGKGDDKDDKKVCCSPGEGRGIGKAC